MKHLSLVKIFTALTIMAVYIFTFGVSGAVEGATEEKTDIVYDSSVESSSESVPESENFGLPTLAQNYVPFEYDLSDVAKQYLSEKYPEQSSGEDETPNGDVPPFSSSSQSSVSSSSHSSLSNSSSSASSSISSSSSSYKSSSSSSSSSSKSSSKSSGSLSSSSFSSSSKSSSSSSKSASSSSKSSSSSSKATSSSSKASSSSNQSSSSSSQSTLSGPANEEVWVNNNGTIVRGTALDIVSRIVMNEVGSTFSPEAIKAQAVAAYTNVKRCNNAGSAASVLLKNSVTVKVRDLVAEVIGEAVYYNGKLIQAVYSASSAGYTASSKNVWGVEYPYLHSIYCELDEKYDPNYGRTQTFTADAIKTKIYDKTGIELSGDPSEWFEIVDYIEGKYVGNMKIGGQSTYINSNGKTVKITGRVLRETILNYGIRSHAFDISYDSSSDKFTFTTYGYGHGVGLSQNGANALATHLGWNYKQILEFYYQGAVVK